MSRPSSNGRLGSRGRAKDSFVDETLFGSSKKLGSNGNSPAKMTSPAPVSPPVGGITIKARDIKKMLSDSPIKTAEEIQAAKQKEQEAREAKMASSKARKERMMYLEEQAKKQQQPSETDLLKMKHDTAIKSNAEKLLEEQKDEVKHMNQMMLYAKCVTIRDAQIEEKKNLMVEEEEEQRRLDLMMEIERIKALEQYEEREKKRAEEQRRGAAVIQAQIEERKREKMRQEELRDQERIQMMKELERLKEQELQAQLEKKLQIKVMMEEVAQTNAEQIKRKDVMKQRERDEDARIAEYIRQRDLREQELLAERERVAKMKELETARLRAQQERAADKQAEIDEIRARRYQEAKERDWRSKERGQLERQALLDAEMASAREAQKAAKLQLRAEMALREQEEFQRVLAVNRQKEAEELQAALAAATLNRQYKAQLQAQIQADQEKRAIERKEFLEEGARIRLEAEKERQRIEMIKTRKLKELEDVGVPVKYRAELAKTRIV